MRKLSLPIERVFEVLEACAATVLDADLKTRLGEVAELVREAETVYINRGEEGSLFQLERVDEIDGWVTGDEMAWLYDAKLSRKDDYARSIYDRLVLSVANGLCPLCGHRLVATLDHYLAKTEYALYTVTPANLIPACSDCNKLKLNRWPRNSEDQTLHPYFDDLGTSEWMIAVLVEASPPVITFQLRASPDWDATKRARAALHFRLFEIAELYSVHAAEELSGLRHELITLSTVAGYDAVKDHLLLRAASKSAVQRNSWQAAMYKTLGESEWFWTGGYLHIPMP